MASVVVTGESERLDRIAKAGLGSERGGAVEALLEANPGLAARGPFATLGTRLKLPNKVSAPDAPDAAARPWE